MITIAGSGGAVTVEVGPQTVRVERVDLSAGWHIARQEPRRRLRAPKPGPYVMVLLEGDGPDAATFEVEVNRLQDGTWELASNEAWMAEHQAAVRVPAGDVSTVATDAILSEPHVRPSLGWNVSRAEHIDDEAVVDRGGGGWFRRDRGLLRPWAKTGAIVVEAERPPDQDRVRRRQWASSAPIAHYIARRRPERDPAAEARPQTLANPVRTAHMRCRCHRPAALRTRLSREPCRPPATVPG